MSNHTELQIDIAATAHARFLYGRYRHVTGTFTLLLTLAIAGLAESGLVIRPPLPIR